MTGVQTCALPISNARVLAETLIERGLRIVSGRTESHVMLVDLRPKGLTGKEAETILGTAHMTCNTPPKPCKASFVMDQNKSLRELGRGRLAVAISVSRIMALHLNSTQTGLKHYTQ